MNQVPPVEVEDPCAGCVARRDSACIPLGCFLYGLVLGLAVGGLAVVMFGSALIGKVW